MNNMNSVLIEGTIVNKVQGEAVLRLDIASKRAFKDEKKVIRYEYSTITIECRDKLRNTAALIKDIIGRDCRIVGRLRQVQYKAGKAFREKIVVYAEHIELRPVFNKELYAQRPDRTSECRAMDYDLARSEAQFHYASPLLDGEEGEVAV